MQRGIADFLLEEFPSGWLGVRCIVYEFPSVPLTGSGFTCETKPPVVFLIAASRNQTQVATVADLTAARPKAIDTHHWWNSPMCTGTIF